MKTEINTKTVQEIIEMRRNDFLKVNPEYQRGAVWDRRQEQLLIDSILRGYPIPLFYFHFKKSQAGGLSSERFEIIDGQQRINAICRFAANEYPLPNPQKEKTGLPRFLIQQSCPWSGQRFERLSRVDSERLLGTTLSILIIEPNQEHEIRDLFIRLQAGLPLSAQEKRDAWPGEFSQFIIRWGGKRKQQDGQQQDGHDFFRSVMRLGSTGRSDPRRRLICAQMYMLLDTRCEHGPSTFCNLGSQNIDNFYHYHVDFDKFCEAAKRFQRILDIGHELFGDGKRPPIKNHAAIHLFLLIDSLLDDFEVDWKKRLPDAIDRFLEKVNEASKHKSASNEFWRKYGAKSRSSTASRETVADRHHFFVAKMLEFMGERDPLRRKDPVRAFSIRERELLYYRSKKNCAICGDVVDWPDAEADHIEPHAAGGITTLENARLVHKKCHQRGKSALTPIAETCDFGTGGPLWETDQATSGVDDEEQDESSEWMEGLTRRAAGRETRETLLSRLLERGIKLDHEEGIAYRDQKRRPVIIPAANKPAQDGSFWLGAKAKFFQDEQEVVLVLLCRKGNDLLPFFLPPEKVKFILDRLRPTDDGRYIFKLARTNSGFELRLEAGHSLGLNDYLGKYQTLD
ncbi:DUF262 domain-containing protein [Candidatus Sumerlaeota bacterium]|nr:DUF262 domain-containing protein [Candidatus Sumerlaeota bacterium]